MVAIYVFLLVMVAKIAHSRKKRVAADEGEVLGVVDKVDVVPCGQAHDILQSSNSSGILYGYGSIPINTIFNGMNIHLPAILMWTTGVQGFDTLPYSIYYIALYSCSANASSQVENSG